MKKQVTIIAKEYRDKVNGNSYFATQCHVNGKLVVKIPFQYGYDTEAFYVSISELTRRGFINDDISSYDLVAHKDKERTKKEVKEWGSI